MSNLKAHDAKQEAGDGRPNCREFDDVNFVKLGN